MSFKKFAPFYFLFGLLIFLFVGCKENNSQQNELIENLIEASPNPLENFELIDVECNNVNHLLVEIFKEDQDVRHLGTRDMEEVNAENLQKFVSIVEKCGFPTQEELTDYRSKYAVFLVLQHSSPEWIARYYKDFENAVMSGALEKDLLAYLQDRFLMNHNKPQIYGTQLQNGSLYLLSDPENVNKRREDMGFKESLETYLKRHGLDYNTEISRYLQ